jgi:MoxR-like ATPase
MEWPPKGVRFTTDRSKFGKPVSVQVSADGAQAEPAQAQPSQSSQPQPQVQTAETEVGGVTLTLEDGTKLTIPLPRDAPDLWQPAVSLDEDPEARDALKDLSAGPLDDEAAQSALMGAMEDSPDPQIQAAAQAFAQMQQRAQSGEPVELVPLGEGEDDLTAHRRQVTQLRDNLVTKLGVNAFDGDGNLKDKYRRMPVTDAYQKAVEDLESLEQAQQVAIGVDLGVDQPDVPVEVSNEDYWGTYEYGDSKKNGEMQFLPCSRDEYMVGQRWKANSGVGASEGRDPKKATVAGAHLPAAADMLAHNREGTIEKDDLVLWHGSTFNQPNNPAKCPVCGKFVSPGKPCAHCGHSGAFAAVYDKETGESACFVEGCPGNVDGRPCPHQLGAMVQGLANTSENDKLTGQMSRALDEHVQPASPYKSAIHAGDAAYVLIKEEGPEGMTFGSADVAERAREAFGPMTRSDGAEAAKESVETRIRAALGDPQAPVPSQSSMPPAEHNPHFVMTESVEETMQMIGGSLLLGYSPNSRGMMGRAFGFFGPPGTGKNEMLRETAATMELPYREIDLGRGADLQALIGEVVLEPDGRGGTRSVAKLGPLGKALTRGEVVALNEIIHTDPDSQTLLHQITQEGRFTLHNPEGADEVHEVHPSSILGVTWNPKGGIQDRPSEALYSRLFTRRVGYPEPEEEQRRLLGWAEGQGLPNVDEDTAERTITLVNDLRELSVRGGLDVPPTFRDAQRFVTQWKLTGNIEQGLEQMRGLASQLDDHDLQWDEVNNLFERTFGDLVA